MHRSPYVILLTDYALRMPQRILWYESFDIASICAGFRRAGMTPLVTHYEDPRLWDLIERLDVLAVVPATSFLSEYRHLVLSTCAALDAAGVRLIPKYIHLAAYENKSLQAMMGRRCGVPMPASRAVSTAEGALAAAAELGYPVVVKHPEGYASKTVSLIESAEALTVYLDREATTRAVGTRGLVSLVVQAFIPGLAHDWKIIMFGDRACSLLRRTRPDDFRASGSGLFEFAPAPDHLFELARNVRLALDTPWVSLDVAETRDGGMVLEYQVFHFGTTTVDKSEVHYERAAGGQWREIAAPLDVEAALAGELIEQMSGAAE